MYYRVSYNIKKGYKMSISNKIQNIKDNKYQIDFILLIDVLLMLALGIVMVMSASSPTSLAETGKSYKYDSQASVSFVCEGEVEYNAGSTALNHMQGQQSTVSKVKKQGEYTVEEPEDLQVVLLDGLI